MRAVLGAAAALLLVACGQSVVPVLRYDGISASELVASQDARDDLQIFVSFEDDDGDVGGGEVRVVDERTLGLPEPVQIVQPIPVLTDRKVAVSGTLVVNVPNVGVISQDGETARFSITVVDRAGHVSNAVESEPVVVRR